MRALLVPQVERALVLLVRPVQARALERPREALPVLEQQQAAERVWLLAALRLERA